MSIGNQIFRVKNEEVIENIDNVLDKLDKFIL
jgi:very-short-patch-repair endonuclease